MTSNRTSLRLRATAGLLLGGVLMATATGCADTAGSHDPAKDVRVSDCGPDDTGHAHATVTFTNRFPEQSDYTVTVAFDSTEGDVQLGTGIATIDHLKHGQTGKSVAFAPAATGSSDFTCRIADAGRSVS